MAIPDFQAVMLPIPDGQDHLMRDVAKLVADHFVSNRVAWAKTHMKMAGLLENPSRGYIRISPLGKVRTATPRLSSGCSSRWATEGHWPTPARGSGGRATASSRRTSSASSSVSEGHRGEARGPGLRRQHGDVPGVLIDGEMLIDHDIGISVAETYVVKRVDFDFFNEEVD